MVQGILSSELDYRIPAVLFMAWIVCFWTPGCAATPAGGPVTEDDAVRFVLEAPGAGEVSLVVMNGTDSPIRARLDRRKETRKAVWEGLVELPPGEYRYFFLVDGVASHDPRAPRTETDDFGGINGVMMVERSSGGGVQIY
jgi:hypothetical protein